MIPHILWPDQRWRISPLAHFTYLITFLADIPSTHNKQVLEYLIDRSVIRQHRIDVSCVLWIVVGWFGLFCSSHRLLYGDPAIIGPGHLGVYHISTWLILSFPFSPSRFSDSHGFRRRAYHFRSDIWCWRNPRYRWWRWGVNFDGVMFDAIFFIRHAGAKKLLYVWSPYTIPVPHIADICCCWPFFFIFHLQLMKSPPKKKRQPSRCSRCPGRPILTECHHTKLGRAFLQAKLTVAIRFYMVVNC